MVIMKRSNKKILSQKYESMRYNEEKRNEINEKKQSSMRKRKITQNNLSEPSRKLHRKSVSFAENLENIPPVTVQDGENLTVKRPQPVKGILSNKIQREIHVTAATSSSSDRLSAYLADSFNGNEFGDKNNLNFAKRKKKLMVPRKMKEKLLQMNGQQRRIYIKQFKKKRKANFDLTMRCKSIWEIIRRRKCKEEEREKAISELYSLVKGKMKELIYAHDTSRVIECLLSFAGPEMKEALFRELIPEIIRMAKSKYARFFVVKMLKFGTGSQRKLVIESIRNHCVSLMRTTISASVLELIYNDYANAQQRRDIESEFYGKEYCMLKEISGIFPSFDELAKQPNKIKAVVTNLYDNLIDIVTKPQLKLSLVHSLLQTFFEHCNKEERTEMIDSLKDHIAEIVHTNPGANVALQCIWHGTAKERKVIVKNFKGLVVKACKEKYGHHVLLGIFDSVDDTVKVNKYIVQEIGNHISEIISDKYGINVLHYLVHPRDPRYFSKIQIELLKKGDSNEFTKKPTQDRFSELFKCISKPLGKFMAANIDELISSKHTALLVLNTLEAENDLHSFKRSIDDEIRSICYNSIATICAKEFIPLDMGKLHPIENSISHFVISKLLKNDLKCEVKLSASLAALGKDKLVSWISCNKGCYILVHMFENGSSETKNLIKAFISTVALKKYTTSGASVLLSKLSDA